MRRVVGTLVGLGLLAGLVAACGKTNEVHRAAGIVPADALAYASITLDPSLLQKKDLFQIGRKFPAAAKVITGNFDVSRDNLLESAVKKVCLDYRTDVKPWLGSELAVALLPPPRGGSAPAPAVLIKVNDPAKAKAALDRAAGKPCSSDSSVQYRFLGGYAVVVSQHNTADGTVILDAVQNEATKGTGGLAATPAFANAIAKLSNDRLAVGWIDTKALARVVTSGNRAVAGANVSAFGNCDLSSFGLGAAEGQVAFDVRATPSSLMLEGAASGSATPGTHGPATLTEGLPGSTLGEATVFNVGSIVRGALSCTGVMDKAATSFNQSTGLDLNADILSQLGGESVLSVGPAGSGDRLPDLGFITSVKDHARAATVVNRVVATVRKNGTDVSQRTIGGVPAYVVSLGNTSDLLAGVEPAFALLPDRLVVASRPSYLAQLVARQASPLSATADYRDAVGSISGDTTSAQLLVRFAQIRATLDAALTGSAKATFDQRIAPELAPLKDLLVRSYVHDGTDRFDLRLTFS